MIIYISQNNLNKSQYPASYLFRVVDLVRFKQAHYCVYEDDVHFDVKLLYEDLEVSELLHGAVFQ